MEGDTLAASDWFNQGFSCAQAIVATFGNQYGLDIQQALRVAGAFGGGMARMGETCGAVTGALMVIELVYGKTRAEDEAAKEKTYHLEHLFADRFKARNGSILCRELLGYDISTDYGYQKARDTNLSRTLCPEFVRLSAEILQDLIREGEE